jgi:formamidopyrimidine-DNA glycosylase
MPELPEVEICRRNLERWAGTRALAAVEIRDAGAIRPRLSTRASDADPDGAAKLRALLGRRTTGWDRRGKRLAWWLGDRGLLLHLGMTGRWVRRAPGEDPPGAARIGFSLEDGSWLWFVDPRRFGCVVVGEAASIQAQLESGLGPDALDQPPSAEELARRMGRGGALKPRLMEQDRLAGVGNIHAVEALFFARINPWADPASLDAPAWERLAAALPEQLRRAIDLSAADELVYVSEGGDNPFQVYDRAGEPCSRCLTPIAKDRQAGRVTFWCPGCQGDRPTS